MCSKLIFAGYILGDICVSPKDIIVNNSKVFNILLAIIRWHSHKCYNSMVWRGIVYSLKLQSANLLAIINGTLFYPSVIYISIFPEIFSDNVNKIRELVEEEKGMTFLRNNFRVSGKYLILFGRMTIHCIFVHYFSCYGVFLNFQQEIIRYCRPLPVLELRVTPSVKQRC